MAVVAAVAVAALLGAGAAAAASVPLLPAALALQRAVPHKGVALDELKRRDWARHRSSRRGLLGGVAGVVDFPVEGSANPYMVGWVSCRLAFPSWFLVVVSVQLGLDWPFDGWKRVNFEPRFRFLGPGGELKSLLSLKIIDLLAVRRLGCLRPFLFPVDE